MHEISTTFGLLECKKPRKRNIRLKLQKINYKRKQHPHYYNVRDPPWKHPMLKQDMIFHLVVFAISVIDGLSLKTLFEGKNLDVSSRRPMVHSWMRLYPYYNDGTIIFKNEMDKSYSIETILKKKAFWAVTSLMRELRMH